MRSARRCAHPDVGALRPMSPATGWLKHAAIRITKAELPVAPRWRSASARDGESGRVGATLLPAARSGSLPDSASVYSDRPRRGRACCFVAAAASDCSGRPGTRSLHRCRVQARSPTPITRSNDDATRGIVVRRVRVEGDWKLCPAVRHSGTPRQNLWLREWLLADQGRRDVAIRSLLICRRHGRPAGSPIAAASSAPCFDLAESLLRAPLAAGLAAQCAHPQLGEVRDSLGCRNELRGLRCLPGAEAPGSRQPGKWLSTETRVARTATHAL